MTSERSKKSVSVPYSVRGVRHCFEWYSRGIIMHTPHNHYGMYRTISSLDSCPDGVINFFARLSSVVCFLHISRLWQVWCLTAKCPCTREGSRRTIRAKSPCTETYKTTRHIVVP
eukprot:5700911-Amphidinium_carterae.2